MVAELIREAALEGVRDELPHSIAVVVEEMRRARVVDDLIDVEALLYVERDSQKGIVIGTGGQRLREVGSRPGARSRHCSAAASTSTCGSRSPRTGSATRSSCASSGSDLAVRRVLAVHREARQGE